MELIVCLLKGMDVRIFQSDGDLASKYPYLLVRYIVCQDFFSVSRSSIQETANRYLVLPKNQPNKVGHYDAPISNSYFACHIILYIATTVCIRVLYNGFQFQIVYSSGVSKFPYILYPYVATSVSLIFKLPIGSPTILTHPSALQVKIQSFTTPRLKEDI